jgi:iron complex outermembrane receptor protein
MRGYNTKEIKITELPTNVKPLEIIISYGEEKVLSEVVTSRKRRIEKSTRYPNICGNWKTSRTSRRFQRVNRVKELIPSGLTSSILNTGINIRGLGSPYGQLMTGLILVLC